MTDDPSKGSAGALPMFRPPVNRAMRVLDRAFFQRDLDLAAARVFETQQISRVRAEFEKSKDLLRVRSIGCVQDDPWSESRKCLLLRPEIKHDDKSTWTQTITNLANQGLVGLIPFRLHLDYNFWDAHDILESILPEDLLDDIPSGFAAVGHLAHYNIRDRYLQYKHMIGQLTIDKNPAISTVINKLDTLGVENEFRVLDMELIAGEPNYEVEVREGSSRFQFDFSKVFWNSRLGTEHERLVGLFKPGEAVCDVMAGVGPFAIPAARKGCFVWGNDLNPECSASMQHNINLNRVQPYCRAFNQDAHTFIKDAARQLWTDPYTAQIPIKQSRSKSGEIDKASAPKFKEVPWPRTFSHYVMNLPASAIDFLPSFIGLYKFLDGDKSLSQVPPPLVHVYCFGPKDTGEPGSKAAADEVICADLSEKLQIQMQPSDPELYIHDVRNVAPNKSQYCATFRLPSEVAFR